MEPYKYIEYPKCLYNSQGETMTVDNREEEDNAAEMGWMTAEKYHDPARTQQVPAESDADRIRRELDEEAEKARIEEETNRRTQELLEETKTAMADADKEQETPGTPEGEEGHK